MASGHAPGRTPEVRGVGGLLAAFESVCNRALAMDPETLASVEALAGKIIALELAPSSFTLYLIPGPGGLRLATSCPGEADARVRGTPLGLARAGLARGARTPEVEISGDVELGQQLQAILARLDLDWEEALARVAGDNLAHRVGNAARAAARWGRNSGASLARDLNEYLHEEARHAPPRREVEAFLDAVDRLRADADRLEARLTRLGARAPNPDRTR